MALVRLVVLAVGLAYSVVLVLSGVRLDDPLKAVVSALPAVASALLLLWDAWAWRLPIVHRATHRPRIDGLWEVTLRPTPESHIPMAGSRGPITAYIVITQSYWSLHVRQHTAESGSDSRSFFWERRAGADVAELTFIYENDPRPEHRARSPRHLGVCAIKMANLVPRSMVGTYFTDRYTQGDMRIELVDRTRGYGSFRDASAHVDALRDTA